MSTATVAAPATPVHPSLTEHPLVASCDVKTLASALTFVSAALPSRPPMAVLLGVHLQATPDGLTLSAFDYERSFTETIDGVGTGEALVVGSLLKDMVKVLEQGTVQLAVDADVKNLTITQGDLELSLPLLSLPDYPDLPRSDAGKVFATVTGAELSELNRVSIGAGRDETLPILTAVRLESEQGRLRSVSTDRYRLVVSTTTAKSKLDDGVGVMVPAKSLALATKHLAKEDSVRLRHVSDSTQMIVFDAGNKVITVRLMDGEFPRYRMLIPDSTEVHIEVDSAALIKATQQVAIVAARNAPVRFDITETELVASAGGQDDAKASKKIPAAVTGLRMPERTAYNPQYLLDGITAINPKGRVKIDFTTPTRPAVFTEHTDTDRAFIYLLMPVRLSG